MKKNERANGGRRRKDEGRGRRISLEERGNEKWSRVEKEREGMENDKGDKTDRR